MVMANQEEIIPISAINGKNLDELISQGMTCLHDQFYICRPINSVKYFL